MYKVIWTDSTWKDLINDRFVPLVENRDRYLLLWGGRGSSKSDFTAKKLIYRCLTEDYFRYILVRKVYNTIKDSQYQTIKDIIIELGLAPLFEFKTSPLEITCINGNKFIARGCDDATKLKSVKDPTGAWYEEEIIDESDFITITTSIRTSKADYLQEIFTFNPEVEGAYEDNWFYKRFFEKYYPNELSFRSNTQIKIIIQGIEKVIDFPYTSLHSTYADNRWITEQFIAFLVDLEKKNPYYWTIYCKGLWGNKIISGQFWKLFDRGKNVIDVTLVPGFNNNGRAYNPNLPIHISFDENVRPYVPVTLWQVEGRKVYQIDEICLKSPRNRIKEACKEFNVRYPNHNSKLFVYGDRTSWKEDAKLEEGENMFTFIMQYLSEYKPELRLASANPSVSMSGDFVNEIFAYGFDGIEIFIHHKCTVSINDFLFLKENDKGGILEEKVADEGEKTKTYTKFGHTSSTARYVVCRLFPNEYQKFQTGRKGMNITKGRSSRRNGY